MSVPGYCQFWLYIWKMWNSLGKSIGMKFPMIVDKLRDEKMNHKSWKTASLGMIRCDIPVITTRGTNLPGTRTKKEGSRWKHALKWLARVFSLAACRGSFAGIMGTFSPVCGSPGPPPFLSFDISESHPSILINTYHLCGYVTSGKGARPLILHDNVY